MAAVDLDRIEPQEDGSGLFELARSKTDQEGKLNTPSLRAGLTYDLFANGEHAGPVPSGPLDL